MIRPMAVLHRQDRNGLQRRLGGRRCNILCTRAPKALSAPYQSIGDRASGSTVQYDQSKVDLGDPSHRCAGPGTLPERV